MDKRNGVAKKIAKLIDDNGFGRIYVLWQNNILDELYGIGKKTAHLLNAYLNSLPEERIKELFPIDIPNDTHRDISTDNRTDLIIYSKIKKFIEKYKISISIKNISAKLLTRVWGLEEISNRNKISLIKFLIKDNCNWEEKYDEIKNNPIILKGILNISFSVVDKICISNKLWNRDEYYRFYHYTIYTLNKWCKNKGCTYISGEDINTIARIENMDSRKVNICLEHMVSESDLIKVEYHNKYVYCIPYLFKIEDNISKSLHFIKGLFIEDVLPSYKMSKNICTKYNIDKPSKKQRIAINNIANNTISVLHGKGGTGKTSTVIKTICAQILENAIGNIMILAPTHSAKKNCKRVLSNLSQQYKERIIYNTIQSVTFFYNDKHNKLPKGLELMVVDEAGMIGIKTYDILLNMYVNHVNSGERPFRLVLVGDYNQLPPLGMGDLFKELIFNKFVSIYELTRNFRSSCSDIPQFCKMVLGSSNVKDFWTLKKDSDNYKRYKDVHYFFGEWNTKLNDVLDILHSQGYEPYNKNCKNNRIFQIITCLNDTCKKICPIIRKKWKGYDNNHIYNVGDPVYMRHNYFALFNNGDPAIIIGIYTDDINEENEHTTDDEYNTDDDDIHFNKRKRIDRYDRETLYIIDIDIDDEIINAYNDDASNMNHDSRIFFTEGRKLVVPEKYMKPSYCITVHSSQGLEFPVVVYIIEKNNKMINRRLNYTAYSRAKQSLYLVGDICGFNGMKARNDPPPVNTLMKEMINMQVHKKKEENNYVIIKDHVTNRACESVCESECESFCGGAYGSRKRATTSIILQDMKKEIRKQIPQRVRWDVWELYIGKFANGCTTGECYVYSEHKIEFTNFHCGHVISVKNGGCNDIGNLRPICSQCNLSMGIMDLDKYKELYYKN